MGEQYIDLFTAGAYALSARLYGAVAQPVFSWLFYVLATAGVLFAIVQGALQQRPELWLRHLLAVCLAAVLTVAPQTVDLSQLTYGAPGQIEAIFGTHSGAAPHLTYWIERLGAAAATALRALTHREPSLAVPGVAAQVGDIAADPATINDPQLKANLEIWRRRLVPQMLRDNPTLAQNIHAAGLDEALLQPTPATPQFVGAAAAGAAQELRALLAAGNIDLATMVQQQSTLLNQIAADAGAQGWNADASTDQATPRNPGSGSGAVVTLALVQATAPARAARAATGVPAYDDAVRRAGVVLGELRTQLPAGAATPGVTAASADELYDLLGRSVLYSAGVTLARNDAAQAALGSLCQRSGEAYCRSALAPLMGAAAHLQVPPADRYNTRSWTTWLEQPLATTLLTMTALMLSALSTLVVSVLPFALGVAKSMAILISIIGPWLLLWPGRAHVALSWMVGPIAFVSLWSVLFNLWSDIEPALMQVAWAIGDADYGSYSARRLMSIAIALGYMGLPSLALGIVYGESGRALYHASARLENALLMAWHTRGTVVALTRRWIVNSPMVRRWNQRAYRAIGMGPLRPTATRSAATPRARRSAVALRTPPPAPASTPSADPRGAEIANATATRSTKNGSRPSASSKSSRGKKPDEQAP